MVPSYTLLQLRHRTVTKIGDEIWSGNILTKTKICMRKPKIVFLGLTYMYYNRVNVNLSSSGKTFSGVCRKT